MAVVKTFKMPFQTNHFNANQRVWLVFLTGSQAAMVTGRYRGRGRYVEAFVNWTSKTKPAPDIAQIDVSDDFAKRHGLSTHDA